MLQRRLEGTAKNANDPVVLLVLGLHAPHLFTGAVRRQGRQSGTGIEGGSVQEHHRQPLFESLLMNGRRLDVEPEAAHAFLLGQLERGESDFERLLPWVKDSVVKHG